MANRLNQLPDELKIQLLNALPFGDLVQACQTEALDLCDWDFWSRKASQDFQVPSDYFNLALDRGISGEYRYLEILTRFRTNLESIANIDNNLVSGIYELESVFVRATLDNQVDLMNQLLPYVDQGELKRAYKVIDPRGPSYSYRSSDWWDVIGNVSSYLIIYNALTKKSNRPVTSIQELYRNFQQVMLDIELDNWAQVDSYLAAGKISERAIYYMMYRQQPEAFALIQKYIDKISNPQRMILLRIALQCGNENQFEWLLERTTIDLATNQPIISTFNSIPFYKRQTPSYAEYNLSLDAYVGANSTLIERVENFGDVDATYNVQAVIRGYQQRLSNSISVYYLISNSAFSFEYFTDFLGLDVDIANLLLNSEDKEIGYDISKSDLLFTISALMGERNPEWYQLNESGNVDLLNCLLKAFAKKGGLVKNKSRRKLQNIADTTAGRYFLMDRVLESYLLA